MVGVAGRSKGCKTCRTRRVKCDLGQPTCGRCLQAGRLCEGYARTTVFLNHTPSGRLEEASTPIKAITHDPEEQWLAGRSSAMPAQLNLMTTVLRRIEGLFLEKYLSSEHTDAWPSPGAYTQDAINLPRTWVLEPAVQALCMTRVGRFSGDTRLVHLGEQAYVLALRRLRLAMTKTRIMETEGTFAAIALLSLHECYEPTSGNIRGFYEHIGGITKVIAMRTGEREVSRAIRSLFEYARYISMIDCIQGGKRSPLANLEWRARSLDSITDFEQSLYDIGFDLGALFEDIKLLIANIISSKHLINMICGIKQSLSIWHANFLSWIPSPAFWSERDKNDNGISTTSSHLEFPHLSIAHVLAEYWALEILLNVATGMFQQKYHLYDAGTFELPQGPYSLLESAENIERAIAYCCRPEMGYIGQQRLIFPIRISLVVFRGSPNLQAREVELMRIMNEICEQSGLQFAGILKSRPPSGSHAAGIEEASKYTR